MTELQTDQFRPLKDAFGRFATGIAIATCWDHSVDGGAIDSAQKPQSIPVPTAITVNSFTSVSLQPPLVLWCLEKRASTFEHFMAASHYGISILDSDQQAYSDRFAGYNPEPLKDAEMDFEIEGKRPNAPLLKTSLAALDCEIIDRIDAGDHIILLGKVEGYRSASGKPLIYFASQYIAGPHGDVTHKSE